MSYLIDGNNLLGKIAQSEARQKTGRYTLIAKLVGFQKVTRSRIVLVFDGGPDPDYLTKIKLNPKFTVLLPAQGKTADEVILTLISTEADKKKYLVVSSDYRLYSAARKNGFFAVKSEDFVRELKAALQERKKQKELEKNVESPTPLEIDLWKDFFGDKK